MLAKRSGVALGHARYEPAIRVPKCRSGGMACPTRHLSNPRDLTRLERDVNLRIRGFVPRDVVFGLPSGLLALLDLEPPGESAFRGGTRGAGACNFPGGKA